MSIQVVEIKPSRVKNKRYTVTLNDGRRFSFGAEHGQTYVDHHSIQLRTAYRKRHFGSSKEKPLLENLTPSPSVLAYYTSWGRYETIDQNIQYLNRLWYGETQREKTFK